MKMREIITYIIIALAIAVGAYQDRQLHREIANKPTLVVEEYVLPAPKEKVEAVIAQYYEDANIKVKPKKIEQKHININNKKIIDDIATYIKKKEGFSPTAYKDHARYSIGYGTVAKSKDEKITVEEATIRLYQHIETVIIPAFDDVNFQSIEQVYAAIDFSYNLGHNSFKKIVKSGYIDCTKMMAYNKVRNSEGKLVYNEQLAQRRFENFLACTAYEVIEWVWVARSLLSFVHAISNPNNLKGAKMKKPRLFTFVIPLISAYGSEIFNCELTSEAITEFVERVIQHIKGTEALDIQARDVVILNITTLEHWYV